MTCTRWKSLLIVMFVSTNILAGCGGGGGTTMPTTPTFTSTPATAAGGSATQTWNVTLNGNINIADIVTRWGPSGATNVPRIWPPGAVYPAALVPQPDGSVLRMGGAVNPDGTFGIPSVPAGYVWLQVGPGAYYWIAASDFDFGEDIIGVPVAVLNSPVTTTFNYSISGLQTTQQGDYISARSENEGLIQLVLPSFLSNGVTSVNVTVPETSIVDWSKIDTLFISQYLATISGAFSGFTLGPTQTLTGLTLTSGATNNITATLSPSPSASIPLSIKGTQWAGAASVGPSTSG